MAHLPLRQRQEISRVNESLVWQRLELLHEQLFGYREQAVWLL
jgi:hypothetical protein